LETVAEISTVATAASLSDPPSPRQRQAYGSPPPADEPPPLLFPLPATVETYVATDLICALERVWAKDGISEPGTGLHPALVCTGPPPVTCATTHASDGLSVSRFGPTVPLVPAAASVWHVPHEPVNTVFPAAADAAPPDAVVDGVELALVVDFVADGLVVDDEVAACVVDFEDE
jgi:hypothetical protein